jgi:hypothetical protein
MNATIRNRRFTSQRGNDVTVFVQKTVGQANGFTGHVRTTRVWATVNNQVSVPVTASFAADAAVHAAGF